MELTRVEMDEEDARYEALSRWQKAKDNPEEGELWSWYPRGYDEPEPHLSVWLTPGTIGLGFTRETEDFDGRRLLLYALQVGPLSICFRREWASQ